MIMRRVLAITFSNIDHAIYLRARLELTSMHIRQTEAQRRGAFDIEKIAILPNWQ
jgi:hypothetical protein